MAKHITEMTGEELVKLARERAMDNPIPKGEVTDFHNTRYDRGYSVELKESEWGDIVEILEKEIKASKSVIEKTRKYPSETISSFNTRAKHESKISQLEYYITKINENAI